jgi:hypothetical protein
MGGNGTCLPGIGKLCPMDAFVERYLLLCLRLGKRIPGLVDAYYGPEDLSARVESEEKPEPRDLATEAGNLLGELDGAIEGDQRRRWLRAQLIGLETVASRLAGDEIPYLEEVERCYGIRPALIPEEEFARAHEVLDAVLPGEGPVKDRYQEWERSQRVERDTLFRVFEVLTEETRARTRDLVGLPDCESVELELVGNEPWLAFNYYLGGLRSRVVFNTDLPWRSNDLVHVVTHELYPGHHTEHVLKEELLVRGQGQLEETALMVGTPAATINEGVAEVASRMIAGDEEELAVELLEPLGVPYDAEVARVVRREGRTLRYVGDNAAILLHEQGLPLEEVREYWRRWSPRPDETVEQGIRFITDETWRAYAFTYTAGLRLASEFVDGDPARFRRLLTEQLTPADLTSQT